MKMAQAVLLDSGFLIRLMNPDEPLHAAAIDWFRQFVEQGVTCKVSTIALAEYGVKDDLSHLPMQYLQVLPFHYNHAECAAGFMRTILRVKRERGVVIQPRVVVPNDTKMFAQASTEADILSFVSADSEARKVYDLLENPDFGFIDIRKDTPNLTGGSR
jgi:predicted nucleic acid-binding protein